MPLLSISSTQEVGEKADDTLKTLFKAKAITVESESEVINHLGITLVSLQSCILIRVWYVNFGV